jgi:16S rRNA (cytidine1402-2'-O)-methyltransferase
MIDAQDRPSARQSKPLGRLYLVATPIGNLRDITLRALDVLRDADVIACEDTRTSGKLMAHYDIKTHLISYHEHNGEQMRPKLLARLALGESVALISDAGTPLISDPGYKLVRAAQEAGHGVVPLPGACAATVALCAGGLPTDHFAFLGFLPPKQNARWALLQSVKGFSGTLVVYESPKRIVKTLQEIQEILGAREVVLARELTKHFEEIIRAPIAELTQQLESRPSIKGEVVLLIGAGSAAVFDDATLDEMLMAALKEHGTKQAAALVSAQTGVAKSELYARALELKA